MKLSNGGGGFVGGKWWQQWQMTGNGSDGGLVVASGDSGSWQSVGIMARDWWPACGGAHAEGVLCGSGWLVVGWRLWLG